VQELQADATADRFIVDQERGCERALAERRNDAVAVGDKGPRLDVSFYVSYLDRDN
jgi:hypothetical protein